MRFCSTKINLEEYAKHDIAPECTVILKYRITPPHNAESIRTISIHISDRERFQLLDHTHHLHIHLKQFAGVYYNNAHQEYLSCSLKTSLYPPNTLPSPLPLYSHCVYMI